MTDWKDIVVDDVIQGKDGKSWTITARDGSILTMTRPGRLPVVGEPKGDVVRLLSAAAVAERAIATAQVRLGGRIEAVQENGGIYQCPVDYAEPGALRGHVYVLHGRNLSDATRLGDLLIEHAKLHVPDVKAQGWVNHHHNPAFLSVAQQ